MPHPSTSTRIRHEYPPVDYRPSADNYWIDARAKAYQGKTTGQYTFRDRHKALAKAEEIAALVADTQATTSQHIPSELIAECKARGLCHFELIRKGIAAYDNATHTTLLQEAHTEFVRFKETGNIEFRSIRSVLKRINHFIAHFGPATPLHSITLKQVEDYLHLTDSAGNFNTWRQHLNTLFNFCVKKHRWISDNPISRIAPKPTRIDVATFNAFQIENLLRATYTLNGTEGAMMRLYVILGVFAGLRPEEAQRLLWEDISFEDSCIVISKMRTKTKRPRSIPFNPSFKAWLDTIPQKNTGPVYNQKNHRNQFDRLLGAARVTRAEWIQDGLRHTYGSARWLLDKDLEKLARHMGNSARVCVNHYLSTAMSKDTARATDDYVHDHPWQAIGIAAAVGVVVGLLMNRR